MARKVSIDVAINDAQVAAGFRSISRSARGFENDMSHATRGILAGSGAFRSLGRSIAFASGGFLAFGGAAGFLKKSVDAAREAQVANAQLSTQLAANGKSFATYRGEIEQTISRLSALAGIEDDELKSGLTTILRTVPNVGKALNDLALATDIAKARHIALASSASLVGKAEAGNLNLLRRQLPVFSKSATVEQALAKVRAAVAGQASAGTTAQERFGAVLHQTEEIIGQGILPTLNKYLESGSRWLEQMNESGKLQKDVSNAANDFASAVKGVADVVKAVGKVTGSFKNTLKLLLEIKAASIVLGWARSMNLFAAAEVAANESAVVSRINAYAGAVQTTGRNAEVAKGQVAGLRGSLTGLGLINLAPIVIPIEIAVLNRERGFLDKFGRAGSAGKALLDLGSGGVSGNLLGDLKDVLLGKKTSVLSPKFKVDPDIENVGLKKFKDIGAALKNALKDAFANDTTVGGSSAKGLTASQRNTFFDNAIARILQRGGLGSINQQIAALEKADSLIEQRLKVTKDVTRRLNLEDELLQNQAQIRSLKAQQAADATQKAADAEQKAQDARQKLLDKLAAAAAQRKSRQFEALGLTATGDTRAPSVRQLRNAVNLFETGVAGTFLDTKKTQSVISQIRKVLSGGLGAVGRDVRLKVQEILSGLNQQLGNNAKNLSRFRHVNAAAFVNSLGLNLTLAERKRLQAAVSTIGPGGTVPGARSQAFSSQQTINLNLDGKTVAKVVTDHQRRQTQRRSDSRRGPYAGRH